MGSVKEALKISMLGELSVQRGGVRLSLPQSRKTRALLGYLVMTGREHRRDRLCGLLWDVADDPRGALRWSLSKLRPLVNDAAATRILADRDSVSFVASGALIDALELRRALREGAESIDTKRLQALTDAHRGAFLEGLDHTDFHEFQAWCVGEREQLRLLHGRALNELVRRLGKQPEQALPYAQRLVSLDPVDEVARASLVKLLVEAGRRVEAEQQVESGQRQMRTLGVEPSGRLAAVWRDLRSSTAPRQEAVPASRPAEPEPHLVEETPLVGRGAEFARLESILERVIAEKSGVLISLSGDPGVGKSRLLSAFLELVRRRSGTVLFGRAYEAESGRPYGAWIDALRRGPGGAPLLKLSGEGSTQTREQLFASVVETLAGCAGPVVVALDDVQWLDEASAELLHYVARTTRQRCLITLLAARSGEIMDNGAMLRVLRGLRKELTLEELAIGPLNEAHTAELVRAVAPGADDVYQRCAGNPLFALELARAGPRQAQELPATLAEIVRERVERLPAECVDVLRWAAVLGRNAEVSWLSGLSDLSTAELMSALESLERHALLRAAASGYAFAHDLVRQVVYAELSEPRRRLMHHKVAQQLSQISEPDASVVLDLARHASLAGDASLAARACVDAGRRCVQVFAGPAAANLARGGAHYALELAEPERTRVLIDLWDVRLSAQNPEDPRQVALELEELAARALDHGCHAHARLAFHLVAYQRWGIGQSSDAARFMLHAERVSRGTEGRDRVLALAEAARCLVRVERDLGDAEALALEARALAARAGVEVSALPSALGMLHAHRGEFEAAARCQREAWEIARRARDRFDEFCALELLVVLEIRRGDYETASRMAGELVELGDKLREGSDGPCARALAAAVDYARSAGNGVDVDVPLQELRAVDAKQRLIFILLMLATADLGSGRYAAARARAKEALDHAVTMNLASDRAHAQLLLARIAAALGDGAARSASLAVLRESELGALALPTRQEIMMELEQATEVP